MRPGMMEILLIGGLLFVLFFGATRLSDLGKGLGEGIRNFKKGLKGDEEDEGDEPGELPDSDDKDRKGD